MLTQAEEEGLLQTLAPSQLQLQAEKRIHPLPCDKKQTPGISNYNYCGSVVRKIINQIAISKVYKEENRSQAAVTEVKNSQGMEGGQGRQDNSHKFIFN